jgi:hypothetical protein
MVADHGVELKQGLERKIRYFKGRIVVVTVKDPLQKSSSSQDNV